MTRILYLHGFASSPSSRKAQFFRQQFAARGIEIEIPDLARESFERLTISGQLQVIEELAAGGPVSLIGSSLGGYLAALYASRHPEVQRVVMMAPAFDFATGWEARLGAEAFSAWRESGFLEVPHYATGQPARVGFDLIRDAHRYPGAPEFAQPALIFHGTADDVVPLAGSIDYAARHPNAKLEVFESGHELTDVMDLMWPIAYPFLASR